MLMKLNKSRQVSSLSMLLAIIFLCTLIIPINSLSVWASEGEDSTTSLMELNLSASSYELDVQTATARDISELANTEIAENSQPELDQEVVDELATIDENNDEELSDSNQVDENEAEENNVLSQPRHMLMEMDFAGGSGTQEDPYLVATQDQLDKIRNHPDKSFQQISDITLQVTTWDSGKGWTPIGTEGTEFTGSYDGNGFAINKLYINRPAEDNVGLFGILGDGAKLNNITLMSAIVIGQNKVGGLVGTTTADVADAPATRVEIANCSISGNVSGKDTVGGLIGWKRASAGDISNCSSTSTLSGSKLTGGLIGQNHGPVKNCFTTGKVIGTNWVGGLVGRNDSGSSSIADSYASGEIKGSNYVGGLVGYNDGGIINNSYARGDTTATWGQSYVGGLIGYNSGLLTQTFATGLVTGYSGYIGGLIGYNDSGQVCESYASGNVKNTDTYYNDTWAGGLVGTNSGTALISECYARGAVTINGTYVHGGGLVGRNYNNSGISIRDCYATGKVTAKYNTGGLIGSRSNDNSIISNAYYDKTTTGQTDTAKGGTPKTTAEMKQQATFEGWDFTNTWTIDEGNAYPELQWQAVGSGGVSSVTLNKTSLSLTVGGVPVTLVATVKPDTATNKSVTWSSDKQAVATVDANGLVKPVGAGTARITVTTNDGNKTASCIVTVTAAAVNLSELLASSISLSLLPGQTGSITLTAKYTDGTSETLSPDKISWTSDKTAIATVAGGTVTAVALGQATITASFGGKSITVSVTVSEVSTVPETFSKTYKFSDLVSNIAEFNVVLSSYTSRELKVIVPDKHLKKITSTHTPNILTNFTIETGNQVRKVKVQCETDTREAERIESTKFNCDWAGLSKGAEVIITAYGSTNNELDRKVLRLKEGTNTISQDLGTVSPGNYAMLDLISNPGLFNTILNVFSLAELNVGLPVRYITKIDVTHSFYTTSVTVTTAGNVDKVTIRIPNGQELDAQSQGGGIYKRDISGLSSGDTITVRAFDQSGRLLYEKPAFVD